MSLQISEIFSCILKTITSVFLISVTVCIIKVSYNTIQTLTSAENLINSTNSALNDDIENANKNTNISVTFDKLQKFFSSIADLFTVFKNNGKISLDFTYNKDKKEAPKAKDAT